MVTSEKSLERLIECAEINRSLHDHPNITKVVGIQFIEEQSSVSFCLFLEKAEGTIRDIIKPDNDERRDLRERVLAKKTSRDIVSEVLDALVYVHSRTDKHDNKISHRDVKPENILIFPQVRDGSFVIKISDFDSSKSLENDERVAISTGMFTEKYQDPWLAKIKARGERVSGDDYLNHDAYGFGLFFFEMLDGTHLYVGPSDFDTITNMRNHKRDHLINSEIDELAKNAIWTLTQPNPADRIPLKQVMTLPYFAQKSHHIQAVSELNEAIINIGTSVEALKTMEQLNKTFYMVFVKRWKELPFVVPDLLKKSKYSNSLACFLRYKRNLIVHAGQNQSALQKHFQKQVSSEDLFDIVTDHEPSAMIHIYWATKQFFPHLPCVQNFPTECVKAHADRMKHERQRLKIDEDDALEVFYQQVCPEDETPIHPLSATTSPPIPPQYQKVMKQQWKKLVRALSSRSEIPTPTSIPKGHQATIEKFLKGFHERIKEMMRETEPDFKSLKADVKKWETKKTHIQHGIQKMTERKRPSSEICKKKAELADIEEKLEAKWILKYREDMIDPVRYQAGLPSFF